MQLHMRQNIDYIRYLLTANSLWIIMDNKKPQNKNLDKKSWYYSRMELFKKFQNGYSRVFFDHTFLGKM